MRKGSIGGHAITNQYCPIYVYIQNRNLLSSAHLSIMFHIDNTSQSYVVPPPEFRQQSPTDEIDSTIHSENRRQFLLVSTLTVVIVILGCIVLGVGILLARLASACIPSKPKNVRKERKSIKEGEHEQLSSALRRARRIRRRRRELHLRSDTPLPAEDLARIDADTESSGISDESYGLSDIDDDDTDSNGSDLRQRRAETINQRFKATSNKHSFSKSSSSSVQDKED